MVPGVLLDKLRTCDFDASSPELLTDVLVSLIGPEPVDEELSLLKRSFRMSKQENTEEMTRVQSLKEDVRVLEMQLENAREREEETEAEVAAFLEDNPKPEPETLWERFMHLLGDRDEVTEWERRRQVVERSHSQARQRVEKLKQELKRKRRELDEAEERRAGETPRERLRGRIRARLVQELAVEWKWGRTEETGELFESVERTLKSDPVVQVLKVYDRLVSRDWEGAEEIAEGWESGLLRGLRPIAFNLLNLVRDQGVNTEVLQREESLNEEPALEQLRQVLLLVGDAPANIESERHPRAAAVLAAVALFAGRELSQSAVETLEEGAGQYGLPLLEEAAGLREMLRGNLERAAGLLGLDDVEAALNDPNWSGFHELDQRRPLLALILFREDGRDEAVERLWEELFRLPKSSLFYLLTHKLREDPEASDRYREIRTPLYRWEP